MDFANQYQARINAQLAEQRAAIESAAAKEIVGSIFEDTATSLADLTAFLSEAVEIVNLDSITLADVLPNGTNGTSRKPRSRSLTDDEKESAVTDMLRILASKDEPISRNDILAEAKDENLNTERWSGLVQIVAAREHLAGIGHGMGKKYHITSEGADWLTARLGL